MSNLEAAKHAVRRYFDLLNGQDPDAVDEIVAPECVIRVSVIPDELRGSGVVGQVVAQLRTTFPDLLFTVHQLIAEADQVAASWTMEGTQQGEWLGVPGSGRKLAIVGVDIFRIEDHRISRIEIHADYLGAMRQMGALESPSVP